MAYRLTITIPGNILPVERGQRFADPLDQALRGAQLGELGDEGTQMGLVDGKAVVAAAEVDVQVTDFDRGLALVRQLLRQAGAPAETTIIRHEPVREVYPL